MQQVPLMTYTVGDVLLAVLMLSVIVTIMVVIGINA